MDSKDVRILAKKAMAKKNFAKAGDLKQDTWTSADASAWKSFCFSVQGFSKYASKIPSELSISKDHLEVLKKLTAGDKKEPVQKKEEIKEVKEPEVVAEEIIEEPAPTQPAAEEAPIAEEIIEETPAEPEPKKGGKKSKK